MLFNPMNAVMRNRKKYACGFAKFVSPVLVCLLVTGCASDSMSDNGGTDGSVATMDSAMGGPTRLIVTRTTDQITLVESRTREFNGISA